MNKTLAEYLKQKRKEKKISQNKLSTLSGVSQPQIWRLERGDNTKPVLNTCLNLASALQLTAKEREEFLDLAGHTKTSYHITTSEDEKIKNIKVVNDKEIILEIATRAAEEAIKKLKKEEDINIFKIPGVHGVKPPEHYVPFFNAANCGSPAALVHDSGEMVAAPNKTIDFAFQANGASMEKYRIFDGDVIFAKKTTEVHPGQVVVVFVPENGDGYLLVKKCKENNGNKYYVDGNGNLFSPDEKTQIVGIVTLVQGKPG